MGAPTTYLPEQYKIVDATAGPVTTNGGVTGTYVSLKNIKYAWLVLQFTQAVGHATTPAIKQATAIAGTGVKTGPTANIWMNAATATNDTLVKQTSAAQQALGTGVAKHLVIFGIDPASLDINNGFDVLGWSAADSSQASNFVSGLWYLETKYAQGTPPTAVLD
jgi:hypothetical protein